MKSFPKLSPRKTVGERGIRHSDRQLNYFKQLFLLLSTKTFSVFALFRSSASSKPLMNNKFSQPLKGKLDVCDWVSEWGDRTQNKELNTVILMDFQFCCQVSNPFSPSVTQRLQKPQLGWNSQCLFYLGGHHTAWFFLSKSIYLLLTASIHQWWSRVVLLRRLLRVH